LAVGAVRNAETINIVITKKIKVLPLIAGSLKGGAGLGAHTLHRGLLANGVHSRIFTNSDTTQTDSNVITTANGVGGKMARSLRAHLDNAPSLLYPNRGASIYSTGLVGCNFERSSFFAEADVIHLHWVNGGFLSMGALSRIDKPIVWTLRDMWPMTGGCHYSLKCSNYSDGCGKCPQLGSSSHLDLSRFVLAFKKWKLPKTLKIVGISNWLSECARASSIFSGYDVRTISNNIDTTEFSPIDKSVARLVLGIQTNKSIILTGAHSFGDYYKGFHKFLAAIKHLNRDKYHLCFFGNIGELPIEELGFSFQTFGFLSDTLSLRLVYSAADVFVAPSLMDAFGKTVAESMACGTPAVCFDATGPRDIVDHKINGYLAAPMDPVDMARGIEWVINIAAYGDLVLQSRNKVVAKFDYRVIAHQYHDLYREMLDE